MHGWFIVLFTLGWGRRKGGYKGTGNILFRFCCACVWALRVVSCHAMFALRWAAWLCAFSSSLCRWPIHVQPRHAPPPPCAHAFYKVGMNGLSAKAADAVRLALDSPGDPRGHVSVSRVDDPDSSEDEFDASGESEDYIDEEEEDEWEEEKDDEEEEEDEGGSWEDDEGETWEEEVEEGKNEDEGQEEDKEEEVWGRRERRRPLPQPLPRRQGAGSGKTQRAEQSQSRSSRQSQSRQRSSPARSRAAAEVDPPATKEVGEYMPPGGSLEFGIFGKKVASFHQVA